MSRRSDLEDMRQTLLDRLEQGREAAAPLVGQLRQVVRELDELAEDVVGHPVDEIKERRRKRQAKVLDA